MTESSSSSRRRFLVAGAYLTGAGMAGLLPGNACAHPRQTTSPSDPASDADRLDAALARFHALLPDKNVHRANHVPMVIEALCTLGRADAIAPWFDDNFADYEPDPGSSRPIDAEHWRGFLGQSERFSDWRAFFVAELASDDWRPVLKRWVARFAPGLAGAATHGVIRTGHAVRSLVARDNAVRRAELATGLAYWAVNYEELAWDGSVAPEKSVADALARVQPRLPAREPPQGNIVTGLRALRGTPTFRAVAGLVDASDPLRTLSEMAPAFARFYLQNPERRIAFTHSITAPSALRLLAPYLDEETVLAATRYAWQAAAGIYVVYGDPSKSVPADGDPVQRDILIARAIQNGGAHSIKLTEACLREEALTHAPILLAAARDAGESMSG